MTDREDSDHDDATSAVHAPPIRAIVFVLVFIALSLGAALGLYALTSVEQRPELLHRLSTIGPTIVITVPVVLGWLEGRRTARVAHDTRRKINEVAQQVNGRMTELITRNAAEDHDDPTHGGAPGASGRRSPDVG